MQLSVIKILSYKEVVSCAWKMASFFSFVFSCDVEIFMECSNMIHVLETFCFMTQSYNVKLSLFGPRWLFCGSCRKRLRYIVLLLSVSMSVRNKNLSHFSLQLVIAGALFRQALWWDLCFNFYSQM